MIDTQNKGIKTAESSSDDHNLVPFENVDMS